MRRIVILAAAFLLSLATFSPSLSARDRVAAGEAPLSGQGGAVAANDVRAARVGAEILSRGGNAVDAAVATALALAVVLPEAGNLGGGGFAVVRMDGQLSALDFREVAPSAATRDMFLDESGAPRPTASTIGPLASGVPGSPAGLYELHKKLGRLKWAQVVEPAERLARRGLEVDAHLVKVLGDPDNRKALDRFTETTDRWLPGGAPPALGSRVRLPELATTLAAYRKQGPEGIALGPAGAALEATSKKYGGRLTAADLAAYRPTWREPLRFSAFGWEMASMSLPSSGGTILGQTFGLLERLGYAAAPRGSAARAHLLGESFRRAYSDRFRLADPASTEVSSAQLLESSWLDRRAASIDKERATRSGDVYPWPGERPALPGAGGAPEPSDTTHLSVIDRDGNVVALTTTINDLFGCGLWVPGAGIFLNNEMDDFATAPGKPNTWGLIQGEANAVAPGKKMLSSMSPTIAWRGVGKSQEVIALGARGGARIPSAVVNVLLALMLDDASLENALAQPRIHNQWQPERLEYEPGALDEGARAELVRRGHEIWENPENRRAKVFAIRRHADGTVEAGADPRGPRGVAVERR